MCSIDRKERTDSQGISHWYLKVRGNFQVAANIPRDFMRVEGHDL